MSFDCRYKTGPEFCERFQGPCTPGAPGCTLHGKVVMAKAAEKAPRSRGKTKADGKEPQPGGGGSA